MIKFIDDNRNKKDARPPIELFHVSTSAVAVKEKLAREQASFGEAARQQEDAADEEEQEQPLINIEAFNSPSKTKAAGLAGDSADATAAAKPEGGADSSANASTMPVFATVSSASSRQRRPNTGGSSGSSGWGGAPAQVDSHMLIDEEVDFALSRCVATHSSCVRLRRGRAAPLCTCAPAPRVTGQHVLSMHMCTPQARDATRRPRGLGAHPATPGSLTRTPVASMSNLEIIIKKHNRTFTTVQIDTHIILNNYSTTILVRLCHYNNIIQFNCYIWRQ